MRLEEVNSLSQMPDIGGKVDVHIAYPIAVAYFHTSAECGAHTADIDPLIFYFIIFFTQIFCDLRCLILGTVIHDNDLIVFKSNALQIFHRAGHTAL